MSKPPVWWVAHRVFSSGPFHRHSKMLALPSHSKERPRIVVNMPFDRATGLLLLGMATYKFGENLILLIPRYTCNHL